MCPKCRDDAPSNRCIRCGKPLGNDTPDFINPHFDAERFAQLSAESDGTIPSEEDDDIDHELIEKLLRQEQEG